jgi:hypothetical protein
VPGSGGPAGNLETLGANDGQTRPRLGYADYGCRVNAWPVEQLFERYASTRFLYADKAARLQPYLSEILDNWRRGLRGGELIHWVATYDDPGGGWATISSWRSTWTGWQTQHLVSTAGPVGSRAVCTG